MEKARQSQVIDEAIKELYDNKGYRVYSNGFYIQQEDGSYKLCQWDARPRIGASADELVKRCKYDEKIATVWNVMQSLPFIKSYNGTFYLELENGKYKLLTQRQVVEHILAEYPFKDIADVQRIIDCMKVYNTIEDIPEFNLVNFFADEETGEMIQPKKNNIQFNNTFYKLLHYVLFEERKEYIFTIMSDGGQGKSTAFNFFKHLFSEEFTTANAKYLNRFSTSSFAGKRMVLFNECTTEFISEMAVLKQATGSDKVEIEEKGKTAYSANIQAFFLFVGNHNINYDILDSGLQRRLINLPWENVVKVKDDKLKDYNWTAHKDEMLYHIEIARNIEPFDYKSLLNKTKKETYARKTAFYFADYAEYVEEARKRGEKGIYTKDNFCKFWLDIEKIYTVEEYRAKYNERKKHEEKALAVAEKFKSSLTLPPTKKYVGNLEVTVEDKSSEEIDDIFLYTGGDNE